MSWSPVNMQFWLSAHSFREEPGLVSPEVMPRWRPRGKTCLKWLWYCCWPYPSLYDHSVAYSDGVFQQSNTQSQSSNHLKLVSWTMIMSSLHTNDIHSSSLEKSKVWWLCIYIYIYIYFFSFAQFKHTSFQQEMQ